VLVIVDDVCRSGGTMSAIAKAAGEQVVAVGNAFPCKSVFSAKRHFCGKAADRSGYRCHCDVREDRNRTIAREDDHGATPSPERRETPVR
jgi:hypothetical protein